ncbi:MAG: DUF971 domain-containing protein [Planctomycetes bacterium]|nr:DUF971 domain-containing protein [Planctomycetota bacterium]NOG56092.1 DUF971 domain-containing protein [Planctomycetota bacterium]
MNDQPLKPEHLDIKRDRGLTVRWSDGKSVFYPVAFLRRLSPSAEQKKLLEEMSSNPLHILSGPAAASSAEPITIANAEFVGHYAIKIIFSDGHDTGIYSWEYLREIEAQLPEPTGPDKAGTA